MDSYAGSTVLHIEKPLFEAGKGGHFAAVQLQAAGQFRENAIGNTKPVQGTEIVRSADTQAIELDTQRRSFIIRAEKGLGLVISLFPHQPFCKPERVTVTDGKKGCAPLSRNGRQAILVFGESSQYSVDKRGAPIQTDSSAKLHRLADSGVSRDLIQKEQLISPETQHRAKGGFRPGSAEEIQVMVQIRLVLQHAQKHAGGKGGIPGGKLRFPQKRVQCDCGPGVILFAAFQRPKSDDSGVVFHHSTLRGWPRRKSAAAMRFLPGACSCVTRMVCPWAQAISMPLSSAATSAPGALAVLVSVYSAANTL